jgi:hypothetical protein
MPQTQELRLTVANSDGRSAPPLGTADANSQRELVACCAGNAEYVALFRMVFRNWARGFDGGL